MIVTEWAAFQGKRGSRCERRNFGNIFLEHPRFLCGMHSLGIWLEVDAELDVLPRRESPKVQRTSLSRVVRLGASPRAATVL